MKKLPTRPTVVAIVRTSAREFDSYIRQQFKAALSRRATDGLYEAYPHLSARSVLSKGVVAIAGLVTLGLLILAILSPSAFLNTLIISLLLYIAATTGLKLLLLVAASKYTCPTNQAVRQRTPIVTIFVPMFRESKSVATLTAALENLRYPASKLDVKYLIEEGDAETWEALESLTLPAFVELISIPYCEPQTKPKAMNYALPFAKGELLGIFDAEDIPAPDQILKAVQAMDATPSDTVCVQARLNHFNAEDSFVSRGASMEYALWFDLLLTGLSHLRLPVPLGGTSLYLKTEVLREVGGWDPDNVTEDADLGARLARRGWKAALFDSTTLEEAPEHCKQWIGQRSRWIKGFIVTWLVHMRHPKLLVSELGWRDALTINLMLLDGFVAFLIQPLFWIALLHAAISLLAPVPLAIPIPLMIASFIVFPLGQIVVFSAALVAVWCRCGWKRALWTPSLWFYWQMGWFAAVKAVRELICTPNSWVKTEHGVGRNVKIRRDLVLQYD